MTYLDGFDVYRIPCDLGRTIGDNSCAYHEMILLTVALKTNRGHVGWGFSEVMTTGRFDRTAWWVRPLPELPELISVMQQEWWPVLHRANPADTQQLRMEHTTSEPALDRAIRLALWDLVGQEAGLPLYQYLGGKHVKNGKKTYGSPLDFPLTDLETTQLVQKFLGLGINTIKVKIGAADVQRDVDRLRLIQSIAGPSVTLTADANEAWTWQIALERLEQFDKAGIQLEYLEDPLYRTDFTGLRELTARSLTPIIGHDYLSTLEDVQKLVDAGVSGIRTFKDFDFMIGCVEIARRHQLPLYIGNSPFELSVHAAVAFESIDRIEFADLGWNHLVTQSVRIANGLAYAPESPGHGFVPKAEYLHS
jgi:L-alanine-DL-glutamate epimerase-like enolase superfamily enzyme